MEIREILGETAANFTFIGFIREPHSSMKSKYFFYKVGRAAKRSRVKGGIGRRARVFLSKCLPYELWLLVYPARINIHYVCDQSKDLVISQIGFYERLESDFRRIFEPILGKSDLRLEVVNRTDSPLKKPSESPYARRIIEIRYKGEIDFYSKHLSKEL